MTDEVRGRAKGGIARAKALTPHERAEIAKAGADARWGTPKASHFGDLRIGELDIPCAVLPDGTRVLSTRGVGKALGRSHGGADWKRQDDVGAAGGKLPFFLSAAGLKPFISNELMALVTEPIQYRHSKGGGVAHGIKASALPMICDVWLKARDGGALSRPQAEVAARADLLMRGLAHVGVIALVDEATGYQEVRDRKALQAILDQYLKKELAAWAKRFPDDFYKEMFRLKGWPMNPAQVKRPGIVGTYTNNIVYDRLAPGILEELEKRNPKDDKGNRKGKHHQLLTEEVGHPALAQHLYAVIGAMRAHSTWEDFLLFLNRAFPKKNSNLELELN